MGNNCCRTESPCGSLEERSGLLKNDSKAAAPTCETVMEGTCGPDGEDDMRKTHDGMVQVKPSLENGDMEPSNTQENRPAKKEEIQQSFSPCKKLRCNEDRPKAQEEDEAKPPGESEQTGLLQCTLKSPQKAHAADLWEAFTESNAVPEEVDPASVQDKIPDGVPPAARPEKPSDTETTSIAVCISRDEKEEEEEEESPKVIFEHAVTEPLVALAQNSEVPSGPNTELPAEACLAASDTEVRREMNGEAPSCAATEDSENGSHSVCEQAGPGDGISHRVAEPSPGPEPTGLDLCGEEERGSANGVVESEAAAAPADSNQSSTSDQNSEPASPECRPTILKEDNGPEDIKQDAVEEMPVHVQDEAIQMHEATEDGVFEEAAATKAPLDSEAAENAEVQELPAGEEPTGTTATDVQLDDPVTQKEESAESPLGNSEEDLYRGAEELSVPQTNQPGPQTVFEIADVAAEDRCSLAPAVDILSYSEREWRGNTAKSALIRKGYKEMSQRFGGVRRVRGDNYCALRATLFQVLSHSTRLPAWLQDQHTAAMLPKQLEEQQEGLISRWTLPGACLQADGMTTGDVTQQLTSYVELLRNKWQEAVDCASDAERRELCERLFRAGEEELGLLEALKLLMLGRAVELHRCMLGGGDVPLFCWLLFARDTSDCPRSFLANHLGHVGLSAGLEQVEMFLLGYALQCTIQVYRLYKADTEEFVTYYPDDHKDDWPSVCLVTEDDRHYNVPVAAAAAAAGQQHKRVSAS